MDAYQQLSDTAAARGGEHQNLRRMTLVLDALAQARQGLRLADIANTTKLGKTTVHRIMAGMVEWGWAETNEEDGSYVLGFRPLSLALAAVDRYGLHRLSAPLLQRIADLTQDTTYLSIRSGMESICVSRFEGDFPVKTLTLSVGARRPLGVGAGSLALLAFQDESTITYMLERTKEARSRYGLTDGHLLPLIEQARDQGYTVNDGMLVSGMSAVGVPVYGSTGVPVAALSVAAISSRLQEGRREEIAEHLKAAAKEIEKHMRDAVDLTALGADQSTFS